ncbi:MAG: hypothetical protein GC164_11740 [Phycisphaera sp.]|nr:hypothetical protein [Phycisphaera sp.]
MNNRRLSPCLTVMLVAFCLTPTVLADPIARYVIYMIADGAGYSTYECTGDYTGTTGRMTVNGLGWVGRAMSVYPLRRGPQPVAGAVGLRQDAKTVYNSTQAWDPTPIKPIEGLEFTGYLWHDQTYPDSACTISASMTGVKTYNNALDVDGNGKPVETFAQSIWAKGMTTGVVTTVQVSDATPAGFAGVSNESRVNRPEIIRDMLATPYIDVIMGAGNPDYDNDGRTKTSPNYKWIGRATWDHLKQQPGSQNAGSWQLIQTKEEFENLAQGTLEPYDPHRKLIGVVTRYEGKQQYRSNDGGFSKPNYTTPPGQDMRTDVPDLPTMVRGALNILLRNDKGFFLGIEQGEVDRAMHANHLGRMIEAMMEFNDTVAFIDAYLTANTGRDDMPNYTNTLLVVTADHDHQLYGPNSDNVAFDPIVDNGPGKLPGARFQTTEHSNHLVPVYAKGVGSELLERYATQSDPVRGAYLDQTDLYTIFMTVTGLASQEK